MKDQKDIILKVKRLCKLGRYDEAIELTNEIDNKRIAVKAHLLCIEHEHFTNSRNDTSNNSQD